jgi:hypothetical protein
MDETSWMLRGKELAVLGACSGSGNARRAMTLELILSIRVRVRYNGCWVEIAHRSWGIVFFPRFGTRRLATNKVPLSLR